MPGLETLALIVSSLATSTFAANLLYLGTYALAIGGLAYGLLANRPSVPKPEDGSYNLKQNVPSVPYVLGKVKKGSDYAFLEERNGTACHILIWAGHRISGYVRHYLHDEKATLDADGWVISPGHFVSDARSYVRILTRLGFPASSVYTQISTTFPEIWTADHRGDGLATVMMTAKSPSQEDFLKIYPNQMPEHSAIGEGALLYDPRKDSTQGGSGLHRSTNPNTWEFSTNLALMRLWHLCHPVGGKMSYGAMHMPDWIRAAKVADQNVVNRSGVTEKRYHGGLWFRANSDPVEVGRILDEAGEMVVFERNDGKIGVHGGEMVLPVVRLTADEIFSIRVDKNRRQSSTVLAVRGRYVNTANDYNTEDAAIYGDPYGVLDDDTERTKTFDNAAIQSHNHCQRKQKLTFIRANAWRVSLDADYTAGNLRLISESRFVRLHYPTRGLTEAIVEITSSITIDLRNMRVSFSGIVVPADLYAFNAATEEGEPGEVALPVSDSGIALPSGFTATVQTEVITGGASAAFIKATWTLVDDDLTYELQYERVSGGTGPQSVYSKKGQTQVKSGYLVDGEQYRVRLRAWGGGTSSNWTTYQLVDAIADPVAPAAVSAVTKTGGAGQATFGWTAPKSQNYAGCRIYIGTSSSFSGATLAATEYGAIGVGDSRVVTGLAAGTKYAWLAAINASGVESATKVATGSFTVT